MRSVSRLSLRVSSADSMASLYHRVKYLTSPPFSTYCTKRFGSASKLPARTFARVSRRRVVCRAACSRSEEPTSELQSLMRISYDVFCLQKKITKHNTHHTRAA